MLFYSDVEPQSVCYVHWIPTHSFVSKSGL